MTISDQLERNLRKAVEDRRPVPARRRRLGRRTALGAAIGVMVAGSAAYAATALWQPELGHDPGSRPTATSQETPDWLQRQIPAFAEPQTEQDRDATAQLALKMSGNATRKVLTNSVRGLGSTSDGQPIVLVPVLEGGHLKLCLTVGGDVSGQVCGDARQVERGELKMGIGRSNASKEDLDRQAAAVRAWTRKHPKGGALPRDPIFRPLDARLQLIGVVPHGVSTVTLPGGTTAPVNEHGVFEGEVPETAVSNGMTVTWAR